MSARRGVHTRANFSIALYTSQPRRIVNAWKFDHFDRRNELFFLHQFRWSRSRNARSSHGWTTDRILSKSCGENIPYIVPERLQYSNSVFAIVDMNESILHCSKKFNSALHSRTCHSNGTSIADPESKWIGKSTFHFYFTNNMKYRFYIEKYRSDISIFFDRVSRFRLQETR